MKMKMRLLVFVACLSISSSVTATQIKRELATRYDGFHIYLILPPEDSIELLPSGDSVEHLPTGPASICVETKPTTQCFTPPYSDPPFGYEPKAKIVQLRPGLDALDFEVCGYGGGSDELCLLSVLVFCDHKLSDLTPGIEFHLQHEYQFWRIPSISRMPILAVAKAFWDMEAGETHFEKHRYFIYLYSFDPARHIYRLRDRYVTSKKYEGFDGSEPINVLRPERATILERLKKAN